jgi:uncharacterized membrane protein
MPSALDSNRSHLSIPSWVPRPSITAWAIALAALMESAILAWVQTQNYLGFHTRDGDLGNYNQAFWTTVHGEGFFAYTTNIPGGSDGSLWSIHFSPTFLFLVPLYAIASSPVTLLFLKQAAVALGALPVYGIAKVYFPRNYVPVLFAGLYLLSPFTLSADWNNFDPESFIPLTVLVALYFFTIGRFWPFVFALLAALGTIESVPPLLMLFALGGLLGTFLAPSISPYWTSRQQRRPLLIALLVSAAWFGMAYAVLQKLGHGGGFSTSYGSRFTTLGGEMKLVFVAVVLLASGGICILGGLRYLLPVAGFLTLSLLSNSVPFFIFGSQYTSMILPFLFVGAIEGTVLLTDWLNGREAGARHRELATRISNEARALLVELILRPSADPSRVRTVARLERVMALVTADRLGPAASDLRRVRRELGISSAAAIETSASPVVGSSVDAAEVSPRTDARPLRTRLPQMTSRSFAAVPFVILVVTVLVSAAYVNPLLPNPAAGGPQTQYGVAGPTPQDMQLQAVLDMIPPAASVLTTAHLFPQVSSRPNAYVVNNETWLPAPPINESIRQEVNSWLNMSDYMAIDYWADASNAFVFDNYANLSGFGLYASEDGANLYERGWSGVPFAWAPWSETWAGGALTARNGTTSGQYASAAGPSFYHPPGNLSGSSLWAGPRDLYLPPGTYSVAFSLELLAPVAGGQVRLEIADSPAEIIDNVSASRGGFSFHQLTIRSLPGAPVVINSTKLVTTAASDRMTPISVTMSFSWNSTGYLSFPGVELAPSMSLYLVSVAVVQTSPLY